MPDSLNVLGIEVKPIGGTGVTAKGHIIGGQAASADDAAKEKKDPQGRTWTKKCVFLFGVVLLKVHKREHFFGSKFKFCTFL
jgi:hypothetical protein